MIRLLILTTVIVLLYLGFSAVSTYDTSVHITFWDYAIEVRSFFLIAVVVISSIFVASIARFIVFILNSPNIISRHIKTSKLQHNIKELLEAYSLTLCDDHVKAQRLVTKIQNELPPEFVIHTHMILSQTNASPEQRAYHLRYLLEAGVCKAFAAKRLAEYFLKHKYYQQGFEYAQKALGVCDDDPEFVQVMVDLYANLLMWDKFELAISKLQKIDIQIFNNSSGKIAQHYFSAAKDALAKGADADAIHYLEKVLTYKVDLLEAVDLLCILNINSGNAHNNKRFLEDAFAAKPSFEIFALYYKSVSLKAEEIYSNLASLTDPEYHNGLFIAIAAYLGLDDRVKLLKTSVE